MVWTVLLGLSVTAFGQDSAPKGSESPDPASVLRKSAEAIKNLKAVSYEAEYRAGGWVTKFVPNVTGKAVLGERSKWGIEKFRSEVKLTPPGSTDTLELIAGCDGDAYFLIDPKTQKAHQDIDPAVLGKHTRNVQRILLRVLVDPEAFSEELKTGKLEWRGVESVEGVDCDVIYVTQEGQPEQFWYIARKDSLPRRLRRLPVNANEPNGEKGETDLTIRNVSVNPSSGADNFKLSVPEGFTRTEEFAP
jgi:hypothetical protein